MIALLLDLEGAGGFDGTTSIDDFGFNNEVSDDADGVMEGSFGFIDDHGGSSSDENGDGFAFLAIFDHEHSFVASAELKFLNSFSLTKFSLLHFLESGHDSGSSGDGN